MASAMWAQRAKIAKEILKNVVIMGAMEGWSELNQYWYKQAGQNASDATPQPGSPTGMLLDYMLNPQNTVQARWNTFGEYASQSGVAPSDQSTTLVALLTIKNKKEDAAVTAWRWTPADKAAAVQAMTKAPAGQSYQALGEYTYKGKTLPVKIGATVAQQYVSKLSNATKS